MPHVTRPGFAAFGNSYALNQRGPSVDREDPPSYEETARMIADAFRRMATTGERPSPEQLARMEAGLREGVAEGKLKPLRNVPEPVVYYFRVGNRIKIGRTGNIEHRRRTLMPEEVLGWEPDDGTTELRRHKQFAACRISGEWFEDCPAIRKHVASLDRP